MEKSNYQGDNFSHQIRASHLGKNVRNTFVIPNLGQNSNEKKYVIRPDSPRTQQAALLLGINIQDFKIKTLEEFAAPDITEEIQQMRYEHYINRTQSDITYIQQKRREIINEQKVKQAQKQQLEKSLGDSMYRSFEGEVSPEAMHHAYDRTVKILKKSHNQPSLLKADEIFDQNEEEGAYELEEKLYQEIDQFNKLKCQKQQEAKQILESEVKKLKMMKEQKEREEKLKQKLVQDQKAKEKMRKERRQQAQEKLQQIKNSEAIFKQKKDLERQKMQEKLAQIKEKQAKEEEERQKIKEIQDEKNKQRKQKMEKYFQEYKQLEEEKCMQTMNQIEQKFSQSMDLQQSMSMARFEQIQERQREEEQKKQQVKTFHERKEKDQIQSVVSRMIEKEENKRNYMKKLREKEKERQKELKHKNEKFLSNVQGNQHKEEVKLDRLNQRFQKIEQNLAKKKS